MANPIAVPGTVVSSGAAVSPGGAQGPSAVSANANNKASLGSDSLVLVQGTAAGVSATTHTQTVSGDDPQLTNARTPTAHEASHVTGSDQIPLAGASTKGLLNQTSGNTTDFIDGTNNSQPLQPVIWSVRLRSYSSIGNPGFEVDQRNSFSPALSNPADSTAICDRWFGRNIGSLNPSFQTVLVSGYGTVPVPNTSFGITRAFFRILNQTVKASLATGDFLGIEQKVEGPRLRELIGDVHSVSLLVRSSVANLKFGLTIRDTPPATRTLTKLCTLGAANTITLIPLANLPLWPSGGTFSLGPGNVGYQIDISLACGSSLLNSALDTWVNNNTIGAPGQDNFCSQPVNSTFDAFFIQHEPGALCTTLQDCPFQQAYDDALRYYQKTYDYATAVGTTTAVGVRSFIAPVAQASASGIASFLKPMAKTPTITFYNYGSGAANSVRDGNGNDHASAAATNSGLTGFNGITFTTATTSATAVNAHWTADTGW